MRTNALIRKVKILHKRGMALREIESEVGVSRTTVHEMLKGHYNPPKKAKHKHPFPDLKRKEDKLLPDTENYFNVYEDDWIC